jgi:hypothetical protein
MIWAWRLGHSFERRFTHIITKSTLSARANASYTKRRHPGQYSNKYIVATFRSGHELHEEMSTISEHPRQVPRYTVRRNSSMTVI